MTNLLRVAWGCTVATLLLWGWSFAVAWFFPGSGVFQYVQFLVNFAAMGCVLAVCALGRWQGLSFDRLTARLWWLRLTRSILKACLVVLLLVVFPLCWYFNVGLSHLWFGVWPLYCLCHAFWYLLALRSQPLSEGFVKELSPEDRAVLAWFSDHEGGDEPDGR